MSADHYVEEMKQFSRYTRNYNPAQQTPTTAMKRIAVGWDSGNSDYTEAVMRAWKDKVWSWDIEGVSLHGYTIPNSWEKKGPSVGFGEGEYAKAIGATLKMKDWVARQSATMDKYDPDKKVGLYVDEWGIWTDSNPGTNPGFLQQQNTLRDAVIAALNLNIFMRNSDRVHGANIAQMINVLQAMILTDGPKMVLTPTYQVYRMYVPFHEATLVPVIFDAGTYAYGDIRLPKVDAVAGARLIGEAVARARECRSERAGAHSGNDRWRERAHGKRSVADRHRSGRSQQLRSPSRGSSAPIRRPNSLGGQLLFDLLPKSIAVVELQ